MEGESETAPTISLEPTEPVVLDLEELRKITRDAIENIETKGKVNRNIKKEALETFIATMERDVKKFAEQGQWVVIWDFKSINCPLHHVHEVSKEFKKRHPRLMIIVNGGTRKISASWKPKKH